MTDYGQGAEPSEPEEQQTPGTDDDPAGDNTEASVAEASVAFSSGEGMVALAGIILVGVWLIFEVIAREYSMTTVAVVLGAAAAIIPRMNPDSVAKIMSV